MSTIPTAWPSGTTLASALNSGGAFDLVPACVGSLGTIGICTVIDANDPTNLFGQRLAVDPAARKYQFALETNFAGHVFDQINEFPFANTFTPPAGSFLANGDNDNYAFTQSDSIAKRLSLYKASGTRELNTTYVSSALFSETAGKIVNTSATSGRSRNDNFAFVYGIKTPNASLPATGSFVYNGIISGIYADSTGSYYIHGTGTVTPDFQGGVVSITFTFSGIAVDGSGRTLVQQSVSPGSGSGSLIRNSTASTHINIAISNGQAFSLTGAAGGRFFGPNAEEAGVSLFLEGGPANNPTHVIATLVAKR